MRSDMNKPGWRAPDRWQVALSAIGVFVAIIALMVQIVR